MVINIGWINTEVFSLLKEVMLPKGKVMNTALLHNDNDGSE